MRTTERTRKPGRGWGALALMSVLLASPLAEAEPLKDRTFSVDFGPDVCFLRPEALHDAKACAWVRPELMPIGDVPRGMESIGVAVFPLGGGEASYGAISVLRQEPMDEPTPASAEQHFSAAAAEMGATKGLLVQNVAVQRTNGLAVARGDIVVADPLQGETLLGRQSFVQVFTDSGTYTISFNTPVSGTPVADRLRERALASLRGDRPRSADSGGWSSGSLLWMLPLVGVAVAVMRWFAKKMRE